MSTLDAEFLHLEDGITHMHIAGVCTFADPPPPYEQLEAMVAAKLHVIPRYRQRIRTVPLELGRPVWVDDPHFHLSYHLRHTALPAPGTDADLCRLVGRLMSQPLDRDRPLWETWIVEGLEGGRWALVCKLHHCMVDGIAGVGLLEVLLDIEPNAEIGEPEPWEPRPEPSGPALVLDAWGGAFHDAGRWLGSLGDVARDPIGSARWVTDTATGLVRFGRQLRTTPESSLQGQIGPHRRWAHRSVPLADVKDIGHALGGTVNDVVLTAISMGYRDLLVAQGDDPDEVVVRTLVPVSLRGDDGAGATDNRVSAMLMELPVQMEEELELFGEVSSRMAELKGSHMADAGSVVTELGNLAPPPVVESVTRLGTLALHNTSQRSVTTVTTNVPGPQFPLYCLGHEMLEYMPFVPISHGTRVGTAILSYNGSVTFGLTGDYDAAPELDVLGEGIIKGVQRLHDLL